MSKDIRNRREELRKKSVALKDLARDEDISFEKRMKIQNKQDEIYKKWKFYDKFIKAEQKIKENENESKK